MNITVRCTTCYPMRLGDCPDTLDFAIAVAANTEYAYELCDSQGNIYEGETTTNGSGNVSISTSDVPFDAYPGLFNKWAGSFKLTLFDADGDAVPFTVAGTEYTCIAFSFRETIELDNCNNEISCGCLSGGYAFPSNLIGQDGDFYIVETTGVILEKIDGAWTVFFVPTSGILTGANNGLHLDGTNVQLGVNPLVEDTTIPLGVHDLNFTSTANNIYIGTDGTRPGIDLKHTFGQIDSSVVLSDDETTMIREDNTDGSFQAVFTTSSGGNPRAVIEYNDGGVNYTTVGVDATSAKLNNATGASINKVEVTNTLVNIEIANTTEAEIASNGLTLSSLTSAGDRLTYADTNGLLGIKTSAQATAMLDNMVGDGGAGGTKGLVPAPAAGDAAANKFLKADGTWAAASGGSTTTIFYKSFTTVSSSAGLGIGGNGVFFGSIMIPAGTVAANDIIKVSTMQRSNGVSTGGAGWALRDGAAAPLSAQLTPDVADANGFKSFVAYLNQQGVYHCGMEHFIRATQPGFFAPGSSTSALNVLANNSIIHHLNYQSTDIAPYTDSVVDWAANNYYIVFFHRAAVATTMTHLLSTVEILRPQ